MDGTVLVTYASKYGATAEIAKRIADVLGQAGIAVQILPADQVHDMSAYAAVVLGSAVYAGQWRKEAVDLLEQGEKALAAKPVWFFSSGPTGEGDPSELMNGWRFPDGQKPIADRIQPRDIAFFHGVIDMRKLGFAEKLIVKGLKAPVGDFRDWDAITDWAQSIRDDLNRSGQ